MAKDADRLRRNDTIPLSPCKPSAAIFSGAKEGVLQTIPPSGWGGSHIFAAVSNHSPLSEQISIAPDTAEAMDILRLPNTAEMDRFWDRRTEQIESLKNSISRERTEWDDSILPPILPASRIFGDPMRDYLVRAFDLGDPTGAPQFIFGFPIVGSVIQSIIFESAPRKQ